MKKLLITLTAVLTLMSCSKEEQIQTQDPIVGTWQPYEFVIISEDGTEYSRTLVDCGTLWMVSETLDLEYLSCYGDVTNGGIDKLQKIEEGIYSHSNSYYDSVVLNINILEVTSYIGGTNSQGEEVVDELTVYYTLIN